MSIDVNSFGWMEHMFPKLKEGGLRGHSIVRYYAISLSNFVPVLFVWVILFGVPVTPPNNTINFNINVVYGGVVVVPQIFITRVFFFFYFPPATVTYKAIYTTSSIFQPILFRGFKDTCTSTLRTKDGGMRCQCDRQTDR